MLFNRELFSIAVAREDHSQNDCFVLVVMSHGTEGKVYAKVSIGRDLMYEVSIFN